MKERTLASTVITAVFITAVTTAALGFGNPWILAWYLFTPILIPPGEKNEHNKEEKK